MGGEEGGREKTVDEQRKQWAQQTLTCPQASSLLGNCTKNKAC